MASVSLLDRKLQTSQLSGRGTEWRQGEEIEKVVPFPSC